MAGASTLVIGVNVLFCLLSTLVTVTRLQRTVVKLRTLQAHDVMLILALTCGIAEAALQCVETNYGLGSFSGSVTSGHEALYTKLHVALMACYYACNMFVKLSLLLFYRALSRDGKYTWILWVMGVIAVLFGTSSMLVVILQCTPVAKLWNSTLGGNCINVQAFYWYNGAFMIGNDLVLYLLPILIVREVQLSRAKAAAMNVLFALGFIVVVASCMRLVAVHNLFTQPENLLYYDAMLLIWCTIENHLAIIVICLPAVKAALVTLAPSLKSMPSSFWSNIVPRRKSSVSPHGLPQHRTNSVAASDVPRTPSSVKRGSSWFSFGASTVHSKSSSFGGGASSSKGSVFKPTVHRVSSDEIRLQKLPSICVEEARTSEDGRDSRSFVSGKGRDEWPKDQV